MYQRVLVPLDGSELAECVLPHAEAIAGGCEVKDLTLVRVVEPLHLVISGAEGSSLPFGGVDLEKYMEDSKREANDYLTGVAGRFKRGAAAVRQVVLAGSPALTIAEYAVQNNIDLIVVSTHGRSGISRWVLGSVADRLLRSACVPVLMVRAPGCVVGIQG